MLNGYKVCVWNDKKNKVLEIHSGDGYSVPLNYLLKSGYNGTFYVYFITIKKGKPAPAVKTAQV